MVKTFTLDEKTNSLIFNSSEDGKLGVRLVELMISALFYSFRLVFPGRNLPTIFNESHGRETWGESLEIDRTVGWFTCLYPV